MLENLGGNKNLQSTASMRQGGNMSSLGKNKLNRSESGSSIMSSVAAHANQIDQVKIERLLTVFNLMQKNDNIMNIVMLTMRELKSLIVSNSVAVFVLTEEYSKGVQGIEESSNGSLFQQRFMLESGKMIDAISNQPGEIKTCFNLPEDIKYGHKDTTFLAQPINNKEEEIQLIIQCESKTNRNKKSIGFQAADE